MSTVGSMLTQEHRPSFGPIGRPSRDTRNPTKEQGSLRASHHDVQLPAVESLVLVQEEGEEENGEEDEAEDSSEESTPVRKDQSSIPQHGLVLPRRDLKLYSKPPVDHTPLNPPARNKSPFARAHLRSRSSGSAPLMMRTRSSPSPTSPSEFLTPQHAAQQTYQPHQPPAVLRTPVRQRSPFSEEYNPPRPRSPHSWEASSLGISSIQEDVALDIPLSRPPVPLTRSGGSLRRSRPASPLHSVTNAVTTPTGSFSADGSGSPMLGPIQRHYSNDMYPGASTASSSSVSSTPTSWMSRSRSPSISSLETIEDAGEEVEMKEAEEVEKLREAADAEGRRSSFDGGSGRLRSVGRERKRWSVCGGERRGDLDLETIWED